jgi:hypothetical protein
MVACSEERAPKLDAPPEDASVQEAPAPNATAPVDWTKKTFEEFKAGLPKEGDKYLVNGDIGISDEKALREFFNLVQNPPSLEQGRLGRYGSKGLWSSAMRKNLTYCVSTKFGDRHSRVVAGMLSAERAWESVADVNFVHLAQHDARCNNANDDVVFDVVPTDSREKFYAIAFFPYEPRKDRTVKIFNRSFAVPPDDLPQLEGILRHELGHVLGFRHEFVHPDAGICTDESRADFEKITPFDPFSVMNYPKCNVRLGHGFELTDKDRSGAACQYGPANGFSIDKSVVNPSQCRVELSAPPNPVVTKDVKVDAVSAGTRKFYGPYFTAPGTVVRFDLIPHDGDGGDADLYVRLGNKQPAETRQFHDCRSARGGSDEVCELDTLDKPRNEVWALVTGESPARYQLTVTYVARQ